MPVLIGNLVKTETADYPCATREEAEALSLALRSAHPGRSQDAPAEPRRSTPAPEKSMRR